MNLNIKIPKRKQIVKIGKLPSRKEINFASVGQKKTSFKTVAIVTVICVCILAVFSYFKIVIPFMKLNAVNQEIAYLQNSLNESKSQLSEFEDLETQYAHYSYAGFHDDELMMASREQTVDLVYSVISKKAFVEQWTLSENILFVTVSQTNVKTVKSIALDVENLDFVSYCEIEMAAKGNDTNVDAQLTIYLASGGY